MFYHVPTQQAERGKTLYIFNVVQPTVTVDIVSYSMPNTLRQNERGIYFVNNVPVFDAGQVEIQYDSAATELHLGSLTTQISVYGKYIEW